MVVYVHRIAVRLLMTVVCVGAAAEFGTRTDARGAAFTRLRRQSNTAKPALKITDYHVRCTVISRYALTTVESTVWNQLHFTKEAAFEVDLPPSAFISNFTITSNGKVHVAEVKERAAAKKIYDDAKKQGKTTGLVATKEREIEKFRVAVSVPPGVHMHFSLTYEELLTRRLGRYELALGLRPGQPVQNLSVDVSIAERSEISFIKVLPLRTSRLLTNTDQAEAKAPPSTQVQQNLHCAHIHYNPSLQQQRTISPKGINADFVLQYDVEQRDLMGDIQVHDGFFVHYFSPRGLPVVSKDIIFVIDISGSMIGTKIKQTKAAISTILGDLREGDYFNLITFSDKVQIWKKDRTVLATKQNIRDAKEFVKKIVADGWTNINAALLSAAQLINSSSSSPANQLSTPRRVPMIVFLTDGEATIGVTAQEVILHNAQSALGSVSLFALAFGDDADFPLLKRLALENRGIARMVYEDADAALQLKGFYDEVASPLLSDIQLSYLEDQAYDVTWSLFPNYFQGSELVVTGKIKPDIQDLKVSLTASGTKQKVKVESEFVLAKLEVNETSASLGCTRELHGISNFMHRLWAYYTIKELLLAKLNSSDPLVQRLLAEKATNLSLKYNFVTPVTSLVVVKPDIDEPNPTTVSTTTTTPKPVTTTTASVTTTPTQMSSTSKMTSATEALIKKPSKPLKPSKPSLTKPLRPDLPIPGHPINTPSPDKNVAPKRTTPLPHNLSKTTSAPLLSKAPTVPTSTMRTDAPTFLPLNSTSTASPPLKSSVAMPNVAETTTPPSSEKHQVLPLEKPAFLSDTDSFATPDVPAVQPDFQEVPSSNASPEDPDEEINISTLLAASFAPMPGMTDAPNLWEATGILDVSTAILTKDADDIKEYDVSYEYDTDYIIHYDSSTPDDTDIISSVGIFSSSVDGDPHFVVMLPKIHENLCFTVDGEANDVLRLLEDPVRGITVNGHLMLAPPKIGIEDRTRTFFDKITIRISKGGIKITVMIDSVVVKGEGLETLSTRQEGSVTLPGLKIVLDGHQSCWIELGKGVVFLVLIHRYSHPTYFQMEHLGFYIADGEGLSSLTQGLLGQFQHSTIDVVRITDRHGAMFHHGQTSNNSTLALGLLMKGDEQIPVSLQDKALKNTLNKRHSAQCWVVPKVEVERLLERPYQSYVVDDL
ncbi:inter-alpha-trypsin inhibitor heavy chain H6 isoform X1 [Pangasianodon hypophthalmus]|uniref:inter-alpha-trypsin inhibitor heavy chain H6 isoform X1 n=1 Tax=Pangasianodon hypophthalmus TaxID=310915 RepID=UPI0023072CB7|nr:inter-alpha-trypsin inhibitor heavy chain H6 isoform X1 [Pangasianodon hypophthalmus]